MNLKIKLGNGEIKMFIKFLEENGISYTIDNSLPDNVEADANLVSDQPQFDE